MKFGFRHSLLAAGLVSLLSAGCTTDVAGNSAETGSPELAGVLYLDNGNPASFARVRVVGSDFDFYQGDDLRDVIEVATDSNGAYSIDSMPGINTKSFSLEAFHEESGKRLLIQNLALEDDSLVVNDSLQNPGVALLNVENIFESKVEGLKGSATIVGTTFMQSVEVKDGSVLVDSLPAGEQDLVIRLYDKDTLKTLFNKIDVVPGDTVVFDTISEAIVRSYAMPLLLAKETSLDSSESVLTDVPLAFGLDSSVFDFDSLLTNGKNGRFEAFRVNAQGERSATLPIDVGRWDASSKEALFWVRVDSLNVDDSLVIEFNSRKSSVFAKDVFPTNGYYRTVWHFDGGAKQLIDVAENESVSMGVPSKVSEVDGVVGKAFGFDGSASVVIDNSSEGELNFPADTLSFGVWVKLDDVKDSSMIFSKDGQYSLVVDPKEGFVAGYRETVVDSLGDTLQKAHTFHSGDSLLVADKWTYIYFQKRGPMQSFYVDGVKISQAEKVTTAQFQRYEFANLVVGKGFKGAIDELMFSDGYRTDNWVKATYYNQKNANNSAKFCVRK